MPQQKTSTKKKPAKAAQNPKLARLVEEMIDKGADTAEEIHRAVLELPVTVLEDLGLEEAAGGVKKIQDSSVGAIYKLIHDINHNIADLASDLLEQPRKKRK